VDLAGDAVALVEDGELLGVEVGPGVAHGQGDLAGEQAEEGELPRLEGAGLRVAEHDHPDELLVGHQGRPMAARTSASTGSPSSPPGPGRRAGRPRGGGPASARPRARVRRPPLRARPRRSPAGPRRARAALLVGEVEPRPPRPPPARAPAITRSKRRSSWARPGSSGRPRGGEEVAARCSAASMAAASSVVRISRSSRRLGGASPAK
jgi:hypothetical protein